ncbi:MAG: transcription repressor NadR [bacterium]
MDRKLEILKIIQNSIKPVSASVLARHFGVSRQIIVGDIALLRASGHEIAATPKGYIIPQKNNGLQKTIAVKHNDKQMRDELNLIVDEGGIIKDVIVEHQVYGEIRANLDISSRYDVNIFIDAIQKTNSAPLSTLTDGVHLHTLIVTDEDMYARILTALDQAGYLLK